MTAAAMNRLVRNLSQSLAAERLGELPDAELLRRLSAGDAAAFEAVVRRHGAAVLAAARAVLADEADVEDVFQAAFLALWRAGRRIRNGTSLGPWLFGVARRAALKALARSKRRRQVEQARPERAEIDPTDLSWREACRLLHEEIERLPEQYRGPIVLCHLEGRSRDEAAAELGWKLATLRGRLERGRDMLKRRLTRRGVALSAGLLAWLAGEASDARELPPALVNATLRAPMELRPAVVALLPYATSSMMRKATLAAVALLTAGIISAGLVRGEPRRVSQWGGEKTTETSPVARPAEEPPAAPPTIIVKGRVVDPAGKPVAGAKLDAYRWNIGGRVKANTDAEGRFSIELASGKPQVGDGDIRLLAVAFGFAPAVMEFPAKATDELKVVLAEGVPLEGRILTLEGQPVPGVEVRLKTLQAFRPGDLDKHLKAMQDAGDRHPSAGNDVPYLHVYLDRYPELLIDLNKPVTTDRDGRFRIANLGRERLVDLAVSGPTIQHVQLVTRTQPGAPIKIDHQDETRRFTILSSPFEHLARPARLLRGTVREKGTGKPVAGVTVTAAGSSSRAVTDAAGRYELGGCPKGPSYKVTAVPPPEATLFVAERLLTDAAGLGALTVDFELLPGIRMTGHVLDAKTGKSVVGIAEYWPLPGNKYLEPKRDATGTLHYADRQTRQPGKQPGDYSLVVAPGPGIVMIRGDNEKYLDAAADPNDFFPGLKIDRSDWGDLRYLYTPLENSRLMLTQSDYRAIEPINPAPGTPPFEFDISLTPAVTIPARFVDPDGKPLAGVWTRGLLGAFGDRNMVGPVDQADFDITGVNPKRPLKFFAVDIKRELCGEFTVRGDETRRVELRLQQGATLSGRLVDAAGKPIAGAKIWASWSEPGANRYWVQNPPRVPVTDADGKFRCPWLLAGRDLMIGVSLPRRNNIATVESAIPPMKPDETRDLGTLTLRRD
jgi:RNA polymerase sigma factor (sigma-70 family)